MAKYEAQVTVTYWVEVEADDRDEAEQIAMATFEDGSYDGIESVKLTEVEDEDDEDDSDAGSDAEWLASSGRGMDEDY